jgi:hypothetical protein
MIISLSRLQNASSTIKLWEGEEQREAVLSKHFKVLKDARCLFAWPLEPKEFALDDFRILANGSLFYSHPNISESLRIVSPENFCIVPMASVKLISINIIRITLFLTG